MKYIALALILNLFVVGCAINKNFYYAAPIPLSNVKQEMKRPGFWISQHPYPDKVILDPQQIEKLNQNIENKLCLTTDITKFPMLMNSDEFKTSQIEILKKIELKKFFLKNNKHANHDFYDAIKQNMNLEKMPKEIQTQFGIIVNFADQRILPTTEALYERKKVFDIDELQANGLDMGTPVAILQKSLDNKWCYVQSPLSAGWIQENKIAYCSLKEIKNFNDNKFVVVIKAKTDIFLDPELKKYYDYVRMGTRLALGDHDSLQILEIVMPLRHKNGALYFKKCYVKKEDVREPYLPYTARNIITQAFELLNEPYGWGDMNGEQDCSSFISQVFATVGIHLPRNSSDQKKVGLLIAEFDNKDSTNEEKLKILKTKAMSGLTILYLKGHIMLFLDVIDDVPYVIHAMRAYCANQDKIYLVNRVVVSDLFLGQGSAKGSLLERIKAIKFISINLE